MGERIEVCASVCTSRFAREGLSGATQKRHHVDRPARCPEEPGPVPVPPFPEECPVVGRQPGAVLGGGEGGEGGRIGGGRPPPPPLLSARPHLSLSTHAHAHPTYRPRRSGPSLSRTRMYVCVRARAGERERENARPARGALIDRAPLPQPRPQPFSFILPVRPLLLHTPHQHRPTSSRRSASWPGARPAWRPSRTRTSTKSLTARAARSTRATRPSTRACTRSLTSAGRRPTDWGGSPERRARVCATCRKPCESVMVLPCPP